MGVGYYKGKPIPLFESMAMHRDVVYGLALNESGESYYLFEVNKSPLKCKMHLDVEKGTLLELKVDEDDCLCVHCITHDGIDEGLLALPL